MKAVFQVLIWERKDNGYSETVWKKVDVPFVPPVGMTVDGLGWGDRTVQHVTLCLGSDGQKPWVLVHLGDHVAGGEKKAAELVKLYLMNGWVKAGEKERA